MHKRTHAQIWPACGANALSVELALGEVCVGPDVVLGPIDLSQSADIGCPEAQETQAFLRHD